jgi:hypothetical protein
MSTSYGHDQDAEPPTPDGSEPEMVESDDPSTGGASDQDADAPDPRQAPEPPD